MQDQEQEKVKSKLLTQKIKDLLHEGNVRRIIVKDKGGDLIMSLPVNIGIIGVVIAPVIAALGAAIALMSDCTISVERKDDSTKLDD